MTNDYNKLDTFSKKFERVHWREPLSHMDSLSFMKNKIEDMISILYYFEQNKFPKDEVRDSIYNLKLPFDTIRYYKLYDEFNKAGRTFKE